MDLKVVHKKIWDLAFSYQDKRGDEGHSKITLDFALQLLDLQAANPDIVIPAIMLHDVGWDKLPEEERLLADRSDTPPQKFRELRLWHQKEGVKIARMILAQVDYDEQLVPHILEIISQHDTRIGSISPEDAVVRDADKLWRYSNTGFWTDVKRKEITPQKWCDRLERWIDEEGFFFTSSAKDIARKELGERRKEF